jgi:hypothetical protein
LRRRERELAARDAAVLVVSFEPVARLRDYCRRLGLPFRCLSDEARSTYRAYGLGRASWLRTLTPRALAPYIRLVFRPSASSRAEAGVDVRQVGGDFVVSAGGLLRLARPSRDPADRPSVERVLALLE